MDKVNILLHSLGNLDAVVYVIATVKQFAAAEAHFHGEAFTHGIAHGGEDLADNAHTVFE